MKKSAFLVILLMQLGLSVKAQALYAEPVPIIYGVTYNGDLIWYRHSSFRTAAPIPAGKTIGTGGWQFYQQLFTNGHIIYGVTADGNLNWYNYEDAQFGSAEVTGGKTVGFGGWNQFKSVFGGGNGVIYAITPDGNLLWYKNADEQNGNQEVAGARLIGTGWDQFKFVFPGGNGIIYAIGTTGDLFWYKHLGVETGEASWEAGGAKLIARGGWEIYTALFSPGDGLIYAVGTDGNLYWYKHEGYWTGEPTITAKSRRKIGTGGWGDFLRVFAGK